MESSRTPSRCPDDEALGDFADDPVDAAVAAHLEQCGECRRRVDAYVRIRQLVSGVSAPPDGLAERILARVHREAPSAGGTSPLRFRRGWLGYAAAVAVTAAAMAFLLRPEPRRAAPGTQARQERRAAAPPETAAAGADSQALAAAPRSVRTGPLQNVSTDSGDAPSGSAARRHLPGSRVVHVWSAADPEEVRKGLDRLLAGDAPAWDRTDGILSTRLALKDRDVQKLVDRLYQAGCELLSPLYPQPGAAAQTIFTGRTIDYRIKVVRKGL